MLSSLNHFDFEAFYQINKSLGFSRATNRPEKKYAQKVLIKTDDFLI